MQLTRIEPASLAVVLALLGFFAGVILGLIGTALSFSTDAVLYSLPLFGADRMDSLIKSVLMSMGPLTIIMFSFLCALMGFVGGFVIAIIYNLVSSRFGGLSFALAEYKQPERPDLKEVDADDLGEPEKKQKKQKAKKKEEPPPEEPVPQPPQQYDQEAQPDDQQYQQEQVPAQP